MKHKSEEAGKRSNDNDAVKLDENGERGVFVFCYVEA